MAAVLTYKRQVIIHFGIHRTWPTSPLSCRKSAITLTPTPDNMGKGLFVLLKAVGDVDLLLMRLAGMERPTVYRTWGLALGLMVWLLWGKD